MTIIAIILVALAGFGASRGNNADRSDYDRQPDNRLLLLHIRQDLKLIAYMLVAIAVLMGLSADDIAKGWLGL